MANEIISFIIPLLYSLLLGFVWGACFNKKFLSSLAPAYMLHVLLVLLSGLLFKKLTIGIYGGIILAIITGIYFVIKNRKQLTVRSVLHYVNANILEGGVPLLCLFYVFCFLTNYSKAFMYYDEFSHWGMFLKECLRLDSLYCMSPLTFAHKDYVPAITLFETIWCRLSFRYTEADAYRAIQMFMFSMLMPMFECIRTRFVAMFRTHTAKRDRYSYVLFGFCALGCVLLIPLWFNTSNAFLFYHSIFCDVVTGIIFFWCVFEIYREDDSNTYQAVLLSIGLTVFVLSKMIAMALVPLVLAYYIFRHAVVETQKPKMKHFILTSFMVAIPVVIWLWFNRFVDRFVENTGGVQSYDGIKPSSIINVFFSKHNNSIPYLNEVRKAYTDAIIHRNILLHGSYIAVVLIVATAFLILAIVTTDKSTKRKIAVTGIWTFGAGIYYGLLMYFLYCTSFSEYEAVRLASYERYMNSFAIAIIYLLIAVYYDTGIWEKHYKGFCFLLAITFVYLAVFHIRSFAQVLPGNIMRDQEKLSVYTTCADIINETITEDESVYIIRRGENDGFLWRMRYYCNPRVIGGGSIGPAINENDIWSTDVKIEEFVDEVGKYDYLFFYEIDDSFTNKYSEAFVNPSQIVEGSIYKLVSADFGIVLR